MAADNGCPHPQWIKQMIAPFLEDAEVIGVYTRMVPAHHIVELQLIGCPDPDPTYTRYFTPQRNCLSTDLDEIGRRYIGALADEIAKWLKQIPAREPIGVAFSGGIDSGSVFLVTYHVLRELGMSPSRLKAFTLNLGDGPDFQQARKFLDELGLGLFLEPIDAELGSLDIVVAQAGIAPMAGEPPMQAWADVIDINLGGAINAIHAALPHLGEGASIIATGSVAAFMPNDVVASPGQDPGGTGYSYAKRALSDYIHELARALAPRRIRANAVHPTNVNTDMLHNDAMYRVFRPDLEQPTREEAELAFHSQQAMPLPYVEPVDISNAVVYLASEEARYVTGIQLRVDAGSYLKFHGFHV